MLNRRKAIPFVICEKKVRWFPFWPRTEIAGLLIMIKSKTRDTKPNKKTFDFHFLHPEAVSIASQYLYPIFLFSLRKLCKRKKTIEMRRSWYFLRWKERDFNHGPRQQVLLLTQSISATRIQFEISCVTNEMELDIKKFWKCFSSLIVERAMRKDLLKIWSDLEPDSWNARCFQFSYVRTTCYLGVFPRHLNFRVRNLELSVN